MLPNKLQIEQFIIYFKQVHEHKSSTKDIFISTRPHFKLTMPTLKTYLPREN